MIIVETMDFFLVPYHSVLPANNRMKFQCKREPFLYNFSLAPPHFSLPLPPHHQTFSFQSKLQAERSHLKRPKLNPTFPFLELHLLPIILQQIHLRNFHHRQHVSVHADTAPGFTAQAFVDADDDAAAFAGGEFAPGYVFVVFAAFDGVEDEGRGAGELDAVQKGGGCVWDRGSTEEFEWVVEVAGRADGAMIERTGVREDGVADVVVACRCWRVDR